jgi:hypothetical protein
VGVDVIVGVGVKPPVVVKVGVDVGVGVVVNPDVGVGVTVAVNVGVGVGVGVGHIPTVTKVSSKSGQTLSHGVLPNKIQDPPNVSDKHHLSPLLKIYGPDTVNS